MGKTIELPSGATVVLRDAKELKQKDRKKVLESAEGDGVVITGMAMTDTLISLLIESWSFEDLLPPSVKLDSLGELSVADYDVLKDASEEAFEVLFPKLNTVSEDPKAPTAN